MKEEALVDSIREMMENPTGQSLYKLLRTFHSTTRSGFVWEEVSKAIEEATGEFVDDEVPSVKNFTGHIRKPGAFFHNLAVGEVFTYSFSSMTFRCVETEAARHGVKIEYMKPGTAEYKRHGCCTCKRVK